MSDRLPYTPPYAPGHRSVEYRIPVPTSLDEYQKALHYMTGRTAKKEVETGDSGVELIVSEPFDDPARGGKGVYTEKVYHLESRMPAVARKLLPNSAKVVHEFCWNAFPNIRTELHVPFFKKASVIIESRHVEGLDVPDSVFADAEPCPSDTPVVVLNIASDPTPEKDACDEEEPSLVSSATTGRLPLARDWLDTAAAGTAAKDTPYITVCKRVMLTFSYTGVQKKGETSGLDSYKPIFLTTHKQLVSWIDDWFPMTLEDCRNFEIEILEQLEASKSKPES
ncbi:phosphatidylinositol transfer protein 2 [Thecamonas trahens ATCC 50062]|uniref:Phosphatidylinositol transfer protein 2 n=1 Tax=Thecamonas trahens ATCC 50062 TaxID=461836 RepID=A0A0L0DRV4_THETB|nr:phosphatidylinositol transfer protein 2 [Thecamonas trahens ATCC 50062]KNC55025.1 phosphatidylinositol transfer protein 2 [Thecamonas trahens ATCC 50062]|eukprot:XP_013753332.1 phosphatidylinositol transfer protein 2 [Thecamonas trahens ATCC 50062]